VEGFVNDVLDELKQYRIMSHTGEEKRVKFLYGPGQLLEFFTNKPTDQQVTFLNAKKRCWRCSKKNNETGEVEGTLPWDCQCEVTDSTEKRHTDLLKDVYSRWACINTKAKAKEYRGQSVIAAEAPGASWRRRATESVHAIQGLEAERTCIIDVSRLFSGKEMLLTAMSRAEYLTDIIIYTPNENWRADASSCREYRKTPSALHERLAKEVYRSLARDEFGVCINKGHLLYDKDNKLRGLPMELRRLAVDPSRFEVDTLRRWISLGGRVGNFKCDVVICEDARPLFAVEVVVTHDVTEDKGAELDRLLPYGYCRLVHTGAGVSITLSDKATKKLPLIADVEKRTDVTEEMRDSWHEMWPPGMVGYWMDEDTYEDEEDNGSKRQKVGAYEGWGGLSDDEYDDYDAAEEEMHERAYEAFLDSY